jgi:hypothetical protein
MRRSRRSARKSRPSRGTVSKGTTRAMRFQQTLYNVSFVPATTLTNTTFTVASVFGDLSGRSIRFVSASFLFQPLGVYSGTNINTSVQVQVYDYTTSSYIPASPVVPLNFTSSTRIRIVNPMVNRQFFSSASSGLLYQIVSKSPNGVTVYVNVQSFGEVAQDVLS